MIAQRRARTKFALFDSKEDEQCDGSSGDESATCHSDDSHLWRDDKSIDDITRLRDSVQDVIHSLDGAERRWDSRFERVEANLEELVARHDEFCRMVRASKRVSEDTLSRMAHSENEMAALGEMVAELSRSSGSIFYEMKEHRREVQQTLGEQKDSIRATAHEVQRRLNRLELDVTIIQSQRDVDRARTERVEHGMMVLEATDTSLVNGARRLERDFETLYDKMLNVKEAVVPPLDFIQDPRTLALELASAEGHGWHDKAHYDPTADTQDSASTVGDGISSLLVLSPLPESTAALVTLDMSPLDENSKTYEVDSPRHGDASPPYPRPSPSTPISIESSSVIVATTTDTNTSLAHEVASSTANGPLCFASTAVAVATPKTEDLPAADLFSFRWVRHMMRPLPPIFDSRISSHIRHALILIAFLWLCALFIHVSWSIKERGSVAVDGRPIWEESRRG